MAKSKPIPAHNNTSALPGVRRTEPTVVSKNLAHNTELTLMMPVKPGFIPTRDTITYATRARLLMEAFHGFRQISREASELHPFSDVVERIHTIQSYRLALLEHDTKLLLAVSFDQPWEPYIRRIWRDTGPFLDSILCNCVDYDKYASDNGFEAFSAWVRNTQVDADFFYIADNLSVDDRAYLELLERRQREGASALTIARTHLPDLEAQAADERRRDPLETLRTGLRALGVLYRLNDYYPKVTGSRDHEFYQHAVRRLLHGFDAAAIPPKLRAFFNVELDWYEQVIKPQPKTRPRPAPKAGEIQAGILKPYRQVTHGVALLMRIRDLRGATDFIRHLPITAMGKEPRLGQPRYNIAFTYNGLVQLQADPEDLTSLPQEFREGMAARAGMLGDVRTNHPSNWHLPQRYAAEETGAQAPSGVQISSIDFVLQVRCAKPKVPYGTEWDETHPLYDAVEQLKTLPGWTGVQLLSLQPMAHYRDPKVKGKVKIREHFGFVDGISQPDVKANPQNLDTEVWNNEAALGDVLLGHGNSFEDPPYERYRRGSFTDNGTFLVMRKLHQNVGRLNAILPSRKQARQRTLDKMMGRKLDGKPLVPSPPGDYNDFNFDRDKAGDRCPLHAHVRRANPRTIEAVVGADRGGKIRVPRIVRRGMSYGPRYDGSNAEADRGLMFMAYNASIAEQFEIIQRWLSGGNSSGGYSGQSDPFLGVPEHGKARTFRYVHRGKVKSQALDDPSAPQPLVTLQWGLYLFVPSMRTLKRLTQPVGRASLVERGESIIAKLRRIEAEQALGYPREPHEVAIEDQWKAVLEDFHPSRQEDLDALWAAIRANHNGVLRTPYGVLVGSERLVREVFSDDGRRFSIREYWWRLRKSFGDIYLSMDPYPKAFPGKDPSQPSRQRPYHQQVKRGDYGRRAEKINQLLNSFDEGWAFTDAYALAQQFLQQIDEQRGVQGNLRVRSLVDFVLGGLAQRWFGIPDGKAVLLAGEPSMSKPSTLHCPFHFVSSSRYAFSPNPGPAAIAEGQDHGARLKTATEAWIRKLGGNPAKNKTPIGGPMFDMLGHQPAQLASELIGVMHGFLPSTLGNLLKTILLWTSDSNLWRVQEDYLATQGADKLSQANHGIRDPLMRALQYRPVPDQLHRLVVGKDLMLGGEALQPGDTVVIGIGSASTELLDKGRVDVSWVFGGNYYGPNVGTHGCPGQKIAMGTMLGLLAALLDAGQIRAEPAPLILTLM